MVGRVFTFHRLLDEEERFFHNGIRVTNLSADELIDVIHKRHLFFQFTIRYLNLLGDEFSVVQQIKDSDSDNYWTYDYGIEGKTVSPKTKTGWDRSLARGC